MTTWSEIEEQARTYAIDVLRNALVAVESGTVRVLHERAEERRSGLEALDRKQIAADILDGVTRA